jgi:methyl coenzyme M reductase alpha subunit
MSPWCLKLVLTMGSAELRAAGERAAQWTEAARHADVQGGDQDPAARRARGPVPAL